MNLFTGEEVHIGNDTVSVTDEIEEQEKETKEMNDTMMLFGVDPSTGNIGYAYALIKKNGGC